MDYSIKRADSSALDDIECLLPRLADFNVPSHRKAEHLWLGDREMVRGWASGQRPEVEVIVAINNDNQKTVGVAVVSHRKELLSGEPSAHLEVLALSKSAEGHGIATSLMQEIENIAVTNGASSLSLHVFANNAKARALYERQGFDGELLRYYKPLVSNDA